MIENDRIHAAVLILGILLVRASCPETACGYTPIDDTPIDGAD